MNEIFVVDSYANSPEQVDMLASMVDHLTTAGRDVCLVSHLPILERLITPSVKFTIFDSNNIIGRSAMIVVSRQGDFEYQYRPAEIYHGAAVYSNMYNALKLLAKRYAWVHFVECDLDCKDVEKYLAGGFAPLASRPDVSVIGFVGRLDDPMSAPTQISTNLLSMRPEIAELLPLVASWEDYQRFGDGQFMIFEAWLLHQFNAGNIRCALLRPTEVANRSHLEGEYTIVKCPQFDPLFTVVVFNRSSRELECKTNSGLAFRIPPQTTARIENLQESDEFLINSAGAARVCRHPLTTMCTGVIRKNGIAWGPGWIDESPANMNPG